MRFFIPPARWDFSHSWTLPDLMSHQKTNLEHLGLLLLGVLLGVVLGEKGGVIFLHVLRKRIGERRGLVVQQAPLGEARTVVLG